MTRRLSVPQKCCGIVWFLTAFAALLCQGLCKDSDAVAPVGIADLPEGMRWTVEIHPPSSPGQSGNSGESGKPAFLHADGGPPELVREENEFANRIRKQTRIYSNGVEISRYATAGILVSTDPTTGRPIAESAGSDAFGGTLDSRQFQELHWLSPALFVGVQKIGEKDYDLYESRWPFQESNSEEEAADGPPDNRGELHHDPRPLAGHPTIRASICRMTRLPFRIDSPVATKIYTFEPLNTQLGIPVETAAAIEEFRKHQERLIRRYAVPY